MHLRNNSKIAHNDTRLSLALTLDSKVLRNHSNALDNNATSQVANSTAQHCMWNGSLTSNEDLTSTNSAINGANPLVTNNNTNT